MDTRTQPLTTRLLAVVAAFLVAMALFVAVAPSAQAGVYQEIFVGGVLVTPDNADDVLGDGTVSFDRETSTLTLDNATIPTALIDEEEGDAIGIGVYGQGITLNLVGDNKIVYDHAVASGYVLGIDVYASDAPGLPENIYAGLYITGEGSLSIFLDTEVSLDDDSISGPVEGASFMYGFVCGIFAGGGGDIVVDGTTLSVTAGNPKVLMAGHTTFGTEIYGGLGLIDATVNVTGGGGIESRGMSANNIWIVGDSDVTVTACPTDYVSMGVETGSLEVLDTSTLTTFASSNRYAEGIGANYLYAADSAQISGFAKFCDLEFPSYFFPTEERAAQSAFKPALFDNELVAGFSVSEIEVSDTAVLVASGESTAMFNWRDPLSIDMSGHKYGGAFVSKQYGRSLIDGEKWDGETRLYSTEEEASPYLYVRIPAVPMVERIAGDYANETAVLISQAAFIASDWVIVARDDDFADALVSTGLAGALDCPIILTGRTALSPAAADEIERLGATSAYVIGGSAAIEDQVVTDLEGLGLDVERIWGENSYDTSLACAEKIVSITEMDQAAIVAMSQNFVDALSMSPISWNQGVPIILQTWGDTSADRGFTDDAKAFLEGKTLLVAGGTGAVSDESLEGMTVYKRLAGVTGYETSDAIAEWACEIGFLNPISAVFASGAQAPKGVDALAGSALAGKMRCPILLVNGNADLEAVDTTTIDGFLTNHAADIANVYVLGGTYVMPQDMCDQILQVIEDAREQD